MHRNFVIAVYSHGSSSLLFLRKLMGLIYFVSDDTHIVMATHSYHVSFIFPGTDRWVPSKCCCGVCSAKITQICSGICVFILMKFLTKITLSEWKKSVVISYCRCGTLRATRMNLPKLCLHVGTSLVTGNQRS